MRVSKNQVTLLSATVAALFAASANAQVVLPSSSPTVVAVNGLIFARELAAGTVLVGPITVNTILGIGMAATQDRYIKVTLANAVFNTGVVPANLTNVTAAFGGTNIAFGGQAGTNSVIFQVTANAGGNTINDGLWFNMTTGVNIASTAANATVTYEVYEFLTQAQANTPVLYARTGTLAGFAPAVALTSAVLQTTTATAASSFTTMAGGTGINAGTGGLRTNISSVILTIPALVANGACGVAPCLANSTAATIANIVNVASTGNVLNFTGDFTAAASAASINTAANGTAEAASAITATTATLPLLTNSAAATVTTRYTVNGTTPLPVSSYTTTGTFVANAGYVLATLSAGTTGSIGRDGVQLDSPWVTATPNFNSRFFITQTTPATIPFTVTVRNAAGLVTGGPAGGTLASNRQNLITLASLLPADTTAFPGPYQVTFNIAATITAVQGAYALTSPNGSVAIQNLYTLAAQ